MAAIVYPLQFTVLIFTLLFDCFINHTQLGQENKIDCFSGIFLRKTHAGCGFFFLLQTTTTIS